MEPPKLFTYNDCNPDGVVLCVGALNLDLLMVCETYPERNSDQSCIFHRWLRGGDASNTATIFAEYGYKCEFLGTMSPDPIGLYLKKNFEDHHISTQNCHTYDELITPLSSIWFNSQNESHTIVDCGNTMPEVSHEDFLKLDLKNYKWIHFEIRPEIQELKKNLEYIRRWNKNKENNYVTVSIKLGNPNHEQAQLFKLGDVIFITEEYVKTFGFVEKEHAMKTLTRRIRKDAILVCSWGENVMDGAAVRQKRGYVHWSRPFRPAPVLNTFGVEDTFIAGTIMYLMRGNHIKHAIRMGVKIAGTKITMHDTKGLSELCPLYDRRPFINTNL